MKHIIGLFLVFSLFGNSMAQNADLNLLKKININHPTKMDGTFRLIANTTSTIAFVIPLTVVADGLARNDKTITDKGIVQGAALLTAMVFTTGIKIVIRRERPFNASQDIDKKIDVGGFSFPSGHTAAAFATATALSLAFPKWYVIGPSYLWACSVAYSRMFLGVHYPTDVLGGIVIGVGSSLLCFNAQRWIK